MARAPTSDAHPARAIWTHHGVARHNECGGSVGGRHCSGARGYEAQEYRYTVSFENTRTPLARRRVNQAWELWARDADAIKRGQQSWQSNLLRRLPETGDVNEPVSYTHLRAHETRHDLVC